MVPDPKNTDDLEDNTNIDWNVFAKMYAKDYDPRPFYFTQTSPAGKVRIACWCCDPDYTWSIAEEVVAEFPQKVAVLLKVEAEEPTESDPWDRYHAEAVDKQHVLAIVKKFRDYVLGDGTNEFAIRRTDTGEYIALDCAGVLWLYPIDDGRRWIELLEARTYPLKYRTLLTGVFHWKRKAAGGDALRDSLILDLGLDPVEPAYS